MELNESNCERFQRPVKVKFTTGTKARSHFGSMTVNPATCVKCRRLKVATPLPRSKAVAATTRS
jgi:hypothetical protein